ncbi:MAG: DUF4238 domain-containing protein [Petrimonas sp.]|uniref:DUF4238 domain-containing protein n=1 Tax=Petrimonas sp. TaxID=2023866 RepID=UPI002B3C35AE|nr:DUF4238 domain-containing protein [Petrimonas sp.]MEA5045397.1 DUF4238 domain-containing protein [Petrimonas sp.]
MKQHYIPRCYLKRFSDNDKSIFTYDKQQSKAYPASMMSVCCEDDMYSISDSYIEENNKETGSHLNRLSLEHSHFANSVEPMFSQLLQSIDVIKDEWISKREQYRLQFKEKREIALHLVTQFFRHPQLKDSTVDDYLRIEKARIDMVKLFLAKEKGDESINDLKIDVQCEAPVLHAQLTYLNNELLMNFADAIASNIWMFLVSKNRDFYTSDFPIVVEPHVKNARPMYMGLAQYGGKLTYPLSPDLMLVVFDREYFKEKEEYDCTFSIAVDKEIRRQNMLRYFYAKRHIFSSKKDFSLIDMIYKVEGRHIFKNANFKSGIVSGLGKY